MAKTDWQPRFIETDPDPVPGTRLHRRPRVKTSPAGALLHHAF
jgi:hypothetical protein